MCKKRDFRNWAVGMQDNDLQDKGSWWDNPKNCPHLTPEESFHARVEQLMGGPSRAQKYPELRRQSWRKARQLEFPKQMGEKRPSQGQNHGNCRKVPFGLHLNCYQHICWRKAPRARGTVTGGSMQSNPQSRKRPFHQLARFGKNHVMHWELSRVFSTGEKISLSLKAALVLPRNT